MTPAEAATVAAVRAYCDAVAALPCDPERASRWCREHSDGTARGLLEAAWRLGEGLPWELVRPEGPLDLRAWERIAQGARPAVLDVGDVAAPRVERWRRAA